MTTINKVEIRGYVGNYIKLPTQRGQPARFDVLTADRVTTEDGQQITLKNWHTIQTSDLTKVREEIHSAAEVHIRGRLVTRQLGDYREVEILAQELEVLATAKERGR